MSATGSTSTSQGIAPPPKCVVGHIKFGCPEKSERTDSEGKKQIRYYHYELSFSAIRHCINHVGTNEKCEDSGHVLVFKSGEDCPFCQVLDTCKMVCNVTTDLPKNRCRPEEVDHVYQCEPHKDLGIVGGKLATCKKPPGSFTITKNCLLCVEASDLEKLQEVQVREDAFNKHQFTTQDGQRYTRE